jgi:hypothetical protein
MKTQNKYSPELGERAVRMVFEHAQASTLRLRSARGRR